MVQAKVDEVCQPVSTAVTQSIPVYRCLVLLGHEFQNFPLEVKKVFKLRSPNERNIVKWMLQGRKAGGHIGHKLKQGLSSNQVYTITGGPQHQLQRDESLQLYSGAQ